MPCRAGFKFQVTLASEARRAHVTESWQVSTVLVMIGRDSDRPGRGPGPDRLGECLPGVSDSESGRVSGLRVSEQAVSESESDGSPSLPV